MKGRRKRKWSPCMGRSHAQAFRLLLGAASVRASRENGEWSSRRRFPSASSSPASPGDPSAAVKTWAQGIFAARRRPRRSRGVILIHSCPIIYLDSDLPEAGLGVARRGRLRSPRPLPVGCRQEPVEGASDYPPRVEVAEPLLPPSWSASSLDRLMAEGFLAPAMAT
jgi:hypothetical protein